MGTNLTVATDISPSVALAMDKRALLVGQSTIVLNQFGQPASLKENLGSSYRWYRYLRLSRATTPVTRDSLTGGITPDMLRTMEIVAEPVEYAKYVPVSVHARLTTIDAELNGAIDVVAEQKARTLDYLANAAVGTGLLRRRADGDATYQKDTVTTAAGTTTTVVSTNLTEANDFWTGGYVTITDPTSPAYGETRRVTSFVNSTGTITVASAFYAAPGNGKRFRVTIGTGLTSGDVLSHDCFRLARRDLRKAGAPTFGGYYVLVADPDTLADFVKDDIFVEAAKYRSEVQTLFNGEVGKWLQFRVVEQTEPWREDTDGTQNADGLVRCVYALGKQAFGNVELSGYPTQIIYRRWSELGQSLPLYDSIGWIVSYDCQPLNGTWGVNLLCGATA